MTEGYFSCKIAQGYVEEGQQAGELVIAFDVDLETGETITCRHPCFGECGHLAKGVIEHLRLPWPHGIEAINSVQGAEVRVRVKADKYGNMKGYIVTNTRKLADPATVAAGVAKLAAKEQPDDDNIPF